MGRTIQLLQDGVLAGAHFSWDLTKLPGQNLPHVSKQTAIGIVVAISGNVLISFALNLQKLVHKRSQQRRLDATNGTAKQDSRTTDGVLAEEAEEEEGQDEHQLNAPSETITSAALVEAQPLIDPPSVCVQDYGSTATDLGRGVSGTQDVHGKSHPTILSRLVPFKLKTKRPGPTRTTLPIDIVTEEAAMHGLSHNHKKHRPAEEDAVEQTEGDYLKSKTWCVPPALTCNGSPI